MPKPIFSLHIAPWSFFQRYFFGWLLLVPGLCYAQTPFTCENQFFLTLSANPPSLNEVVIDPQTGNVVFNSINANIVLPVNAAGYRSTDNFIYCIDPETRALVRLDGNGQPAIMAFLPLTSTVSYFAGDVTPDGQFLIVIGTQFFSNGSAFAREVVRVDLTNPAYPVDIININSPAQIFDIAFHPVTDVLYGYDSFTQRLVRIDPLTGDITYPVPTSNVPVVTGSLFFDAYGNLFAYGSPTFTQDQNSLYQIDINTGVSTFLTRGDAASSSDGCSCPYTIELSKSVLPETTQPCGEVEYTFTMVNSSRQFQDDLRLEDALPPGFTFVRVSLNTVGGDLLTPPGSSNFILDNFSLPPGVTEIKIIVNVGDVNAGVYKNQAVLRNLPASLGSRRFSDNLKTLAVDDSTALTITRFSFDTIRVSRTFCAGDLSLRLDASGFANQVSGQVNYYWQDGSTGAFIDVDGPGDYQTILSAGCDTAVVLYDVGFSSIMVEVARDTFTLALGDSINIEAIATNTEAITFYQWLDPQPGSIRCPTCAESIARPFNDLEYAIVASNNLGCQDTAYIRVRVDKDRNIYFPNVFTPDGPDQVNSYFYGFGDQFVRLESLAVFSRWGEKMFENRNTVLNDPFVGWDGSYRGEPANPGVYVWVAKVAFLDGLTVTYAGDVTLIR